MSNRRTQCIRNWMQAARNAGLVKTLGGFEIEAAVIIAAGIEFAENPFNPRSDETPNGHPRRPS